MDQDNSGRPGGISSCGSSQQAVSPVPASIPDAVRRAFMELARLLEREAHASARVAKAKGGISGLMDAAEAGALIKVARHIFNVAQGMSTGTAKTAEPVEGQSPASPVRQDAPIPVTYDTPLSHKE